MSSHPIDAPVNLNFPPQTFSSLLNSSGTPSHPQAAFHQHIQQMHAMMMAQRQLQQQQQQQQHHVHSDLPHQAPPSPFAFMMPPSMPYIGNVGNVALRPATADLASASMRAIPMPVHGMGAWQQMGSAAQPGGAALPFIEGMLKSWSQGLLAAASKSSAPSHASEQAKLAALAHSASQRKLKKAAAAAAAAERKLPKQLKRGVDAEPDASAAASSSLCADCNAEGSALDVLSAAVHSQDGDRDEASLNAASALHGMLGCWNSPDDPPVPGMFPFQQLSPRWSKKRNRSLLKELAVSVSDAVDDDGMALTPCSKNRSSKQLDSAYNHTTNPEHVCRTKDGAPVVDVHVPALCECGSVVVGVWYRNRAHYCRWFRHERYAPLRALLEQNRRKNKSRPFDEKGPAETPGSAANDASVSSEPQAHEVTANPASHAAPTLESDVCAGELGAWGSKTSAEELLAPKFLSLLCLFQFVKHDDAVELVYPRGILGNTMMKPHSLKISAHIDCERSKGFVQYRWYSTELPPLVDDLSTSDSFNKKVVGCCCLGHWKRKPPGRETSKTTSHLLVSSAIDIDNVLSPFEIDGSVDAVISLANPVPNSPFGTPQKTVISGAASWEASDDSIWATSISLTLLPVEVIAASKSTAFAPLVETNKNSKCSHLCENTFMTPKHDFRPMQSPRNSVYASTPGTAASSSPAPRQFMSAFALLKEEPVSPTPSRPDTISASSKTLAPDDHTNIKYE